jgi:lipopolysaccharide export system permease protein
MFIMQQAVLLLDKIISKGLDPAVVLEIFIIQLGWIIALAIPMAILSATLMTFGRMSGDNEITSIKASGQSLSPLLVPVFAAATLITVLLIFFNDMILPDANHHAANLLTDISRKRPTAFIEPRVLITDFSDYTIYCEDVNSSTGQLKGIRIFSNKPGQDPTMTIASSGTVRLTPDQQYLELTLTDGESHSTSRQNSNQYVVARFKKQVVCIQNVDSRFQRTDSDYRGDREKGCKLMLDDVKELKVSNARFYAEYNAIIDTLSGQIRFFDSLKSKYRDSIPASASNLTFSKWASEIDKSKTATFEIRRTDDYLERVMRRIGSNEMMISQYMVEVHKKFAIPVACIIFVLIGAPLGIMARRGGLAVGASYSIFFFITNWAFLIGGEALADKMIISPAVAMWSGNVLIGLCGIILIILMRRETTIKFDWLLSFWKKLSGKNSGPFKGLANNPLLKLPSIIFWAPRYICRKLIGILPTYIIGFFLNYTFGVLSAIVVMFVVVDYVDNLKRFESVAFYNIALYYLYYLPWIVQITIPIVLLLASMFTMGKLAKNSEIVAMKSAGINIRQLTIPLLFLGILLSVGAFYGGEWILPKANQLKRELSERMSDPDGARVNKKATGIKEFRRNFYYFGSPNTMYLFNEFSTVPQNARTVSRETFGNDKILERVQAEKAIYDSSGWTLVNGQIRDFRDSIQKVLNFDTLRDTILKSSPQEMVARIKNKEEMSYWELKTFIAAAQKRGEKVQKFMGELEFKIALPFMNFIVILLGIAITARAGRKGSAVLFGIGLALMFSYWLISRFALVFAQNGHLSTLLGAWLGNIIFLVLGLILYRKASQ